MIPDYDQIETVEPISPGEPLKHADRDVTSRLLNLVVSFKWRPRIDARNFIDTFRQWNTPPFLSTPHLIVMGSLQQLDMNLTLII